eukprot:TRINITY_DN14365_c0_g2_i1.p1 TRINITY_DN14365_c0_g2~~TRINITY_DN14365_c0_g2_i1.p1  ORF type:complete len:557 (-),score=62.51 TRINITY_DN14365_c0_g2_i1:326-1996(-)
MDAADAVNEVVNSKVKAPTASFFKEEREEEYSRSGYLHTWRSIIFQVGLVLTAQLVYTCAPLLMNYSVVARMPPAFSKTVVTIPPNHGSGLGVDLAHRNGELFVESQKVDGLASIAGILEGDVVGQVRQDSRLIYNRETAYAGNNGLQFVQSFLENGAYASNLHIDPLLDVQVSFDFYRVEVKTAPAYLEVSVIMMFKLSGLVIFLFLAFIRDPRQLAELRLILNFAVLKSLIPAAIANCVSDICELYAAGMMPAALYAVLVRMNLMGTAIVSYFVLGRKQSPLEASILVGLTCLIACYAQVPDIVPLHQVWDGFGQPKDPSSPVVSGGLSMVGLACVFGKIFGSVFNCVLGEKAMKGPQLANESIVVVQGILFLVSSVVITPFALYMSYWTEWPNGLFGGDDISVRHCSADWTTEECSGTVAWSIPQGWDIRTIAVVICCICRETLMTSLQGYFSALVRSLTAASSVATTYIFSVCFLGKSFNATKCGLIVAIILDIASYVMVPKPGASNVALVDQIGTASKVALVDQVGTNIIKEARQVELALARKLEASSGQV